MRVSRCVDVAAGSRHTLAITERCGAMDGVTGMFSMQGVQIEKKTWDRYIYLVNYHTKNQTKM